MALTYSHVLLVQQEVRGFNNTSFLQFREELYTNPYF